MKRRDFIRLVGFWATSPVAAFAQSKTIRGIGIVGSLGQGAVDAFKDGLRERGFVDGKTIVILGGAASGVGAADASRTVSDLISQKIDVIFASGAVAGKAAKDATSMIPIVCLTGDLIGAGLVQSLANPGGNITGISILTAEESAKRLELLRQLLPTLNRVAVLYIPDDTSAALSVKSMEAAAAKLQLTLDIYGVHRESDLRNAVAAAARAKAQAIALTSNPLLDILGQQIAQLALQAKLATVSFADSFPKVGGLMSYGPNIRVAYHRAAYLVAGILRGAKPAELPVEQPTKFSLGINLNTAKALNINVPDMWLASADEVIE